MPGVVSHSSSLRNPCPDGTGIGYATFNDSSTIYVICDAAFYKDMTDYKLALALGLGLGIPGLVVLLGIWLRWQNFDRCRRKRRYPPPPALLSSPTIFPSEEVEKRLTVQGLTDFRAGNLTESLKEELMITRVRMGCDLVHFVKYADQLHHDELAEYIERMNVTAIPSEIHRKALHRESHLVVTEEP